MIEEKLLLVVVIITLIAGVIALVLGQILLSTIPFIISVLAFLYILYTRRAVAGERPPTDAVRVVAVDDEADILRLIRIKLTKEGFDVSTASDGEEGVRKILSENPDVAVVDVMMPGKDGYEVVSEVKRKLGAKAPVVLMLTSKAEEADMVKGLSAGADDYITKPFSPSELIERINVALIKGKKAVE